MRLRTFLPLCVAVFGAVFAYTWVRPTIKRRSSPLRLVAFVLSVLAAEWWNPASWGASIGHIASSAVRDIENWARDAINEAFSIYDDAASFTIGLINDTIALITTIADDAYNWGAEALTWIDQAGTEVGEWIWGIVDQVWNDTIVPAIGDVRSWADQIYNWAVEAFDAVANASTALWDNYIAPALDWIANAAVTIGDWIEGIVVGFYNQIIVPLIEMLTWLWDNVPNWIDWLISTAYDAVMAVVDAMDWIIWFGEHDFNLLEQLPGELENSFTSSWVFNMASGDVSAASGIEADFTRIFG